MAARVGVLVDYEEDKHVGSARNEKEDCAADALPEIMASDDDAGSPIEDKSAIKTTGTDKDKQQEELDGDDGKMLMTESSTAMTTNKARTTATEVPSQVTRTQELNRIRAKLAAIKQKTYRFNSNSSITKRGSDAESYKKEKMDTGTVGGPPGRRVLRFGRQSNQTHQDSESKSVVGIEL